MSCPSISFPHHRPQVAAVGAPGASTSSLLQRSRRTPTMSSVTARSSASSASVSSVGGQLRPDPRSAGIAMAACYSPYELASPPVAQVPIQKEFTLQKEFVPPKDYSRPLHVDCSVEYELPNAAKPPPGVRNEPLLMIHPCYFRKIESQRRSPFVNNLPPRAAAVAAAPAAKRRLVRGHGQQLPQQVPQQGAAYPVQYADPRQLWEPLPLPAAAQTYCKASACGATTYVTAVADPGHWPTDPDRSPDRPEDKHILSGKYRQYLRAHRLHPYVASAIPLASTFPQMQQVCYNAV